MTPTDGGERGDQTAVGEGRRVERSGVREDSDQDRMKERRRTEPGRIYR
jgi:hypothetical protein